MRPLLFCILLSGLVPEGANRQLSAATAVSEYEAKASFLYNLLKFVQWPAGSLPDQPAPFTACVIEPDPFGNTLANVLLQKAVSGHPIELRRLKSGAGIRECQAVFFPAQDTRRIASMLRSVHRAGVLTVGERVNFWMRAAW